MDRSRHRETHARGPDKPGRASCKGLVPGERAKRLVAMLRSGVTEKDLALRSGEPQSYVDQILSMPAKCFPKEVRA